VYDRDPLSELMRPTTHMSRRAFFVAMKWITSYASLFKSSLIERWAYLPIGTVVEPTGQTKDELYKGMMTRFVEVKYVDGANNWLGWVYENYLEDLAFEFPAGVVRILNATPNPLDAAQYMVWRGRVQYNLCGELCVCYCTAVDEDIDTFLSDWESKQPTFFNRIFSGGLSRGTGLADLDSMLAVYAYEPPNPRLDAALKDALGRTLVTPGRVAKLLAKNRIIASCHIDGHNGRLRGSGVLHWVVLEKVIPDGIGQGWVHLYNPFPNRMERYSWDEWIKSSGQPYGILVKR